jgi:ketosteroid isomerase-like protein
MPRTLRVFAYCLLVSMSAGSLAQTQTPPEASLAIEAVLQQQVKDWNRGDIEAFAAGYKNSPDILFIGAEVRHGYASMLAGYKARYATREAMGTLSFSRLAVQPLDERFATVTGHFELVRSDAGGGGVRGYFLLVMEKTAAGWKIVCDDTTVPEASRK